MKYERKNLVLSDVIAFIDENCSGIWIGKKYHAKRAFAYRVIARATVNALGYTPITTNIYRT